MLGRHGRLEAGDNGATGERVVNEWGDTKLYFDVTRLGHWIRKKIQKLIGNNAVKWWPNMDRRASFDAV